MKAEEVAFIDKVPDLSYSKIIGFRIIVDLMLKPASYKVKPFFFRIKNTGVECLVLAFYLTATRLFSYSGSCVLNTGMCFGILSHE